MDTAIYNLIDSQVVYEDNHIIVLNKRPSQIVQGDKTGDACLVEILKDYLKEKYNKKTDLEIQGLFWFFY